MNYHTLENFGVDELSAIRQVFPLQFYNFTAKNYQYRITQKP